MRKTLDWQIATLTDVRPETAKVKSFTLSLPDWTPHRAGQHYDIRLTAADGYQTQRSYSIASEPERRGEVDLTVERIEDGEVSSYMHDVLIKGDKLEVRGPIGGYFVWEASMLEPLLLDCRRLRRCAAHVDAAPSARGRSRQSDTTAVQLPHVRRHHLSRRTWRS